MNMCYSKFLENVIFLRIYVKFTPFHFLHVLWFDYAQMYEVQFKIMHVNKLAGNFNLAL